MYTYKEAYDKIIQAYFNDEILPFEYDFCFCGTLSPDNGWRNKMRHIISFRRYPYSLAEYLRMETALYAGIHAHLKITSDERCVWWSKDFAGNVVYPQIMEGYEDAVFNGVKMALCVLKKIHRSRGENVDEVTTPFVKRQLTV